MKVYLVQNPPRDKAVPGPGAYTVRAEPGKEAYKYSIRPKTSAQGIILSQDLYHQHINILVLEPIYN